jgi:hypothetical protein
MVDPVARVIAIIGIILSIIKISYDFWKNRRRAKVRVEQAKLQGKNAVSISVVNIGHRPTTVEGLGVFFADGRSLGAGNLYITDDQTKIVTYDSDIYSTDFPMRIEDGEPAKVFYDFETLEKYYGDGTHISSIIAWDAEGNEYKGKMPKYLKKRLDKFKDRQ